ncbi:MAG: hypothetical protein NVSMB10_18410 [Steroidobacteraceae bacterium]
MTGFAEHKLKLRAAVAAAISCAALGGIAPALAVTSTQASATPPYAISVFAPLPNGVTQPDSIVTWHDSVLVGFQNHVAKDGTDHKTSTIVEFDSDGHQKRSFSVPGHNDGLRVVGEDELWALQNEDANANLVVIDLDSGRQTSYAFPPAPHGGGYDDIAVLNGDVYLTASNPTLDAKGVNVFPAVVRAKLWMNQVVLEPVVAGNASAFDFTTGERVKLNVTDPDSMTKDLNGDLVFVSQADSELVFVKHPESDEPVVGRLPLSSPGLGTTAAPFTVDDTAFAGSHAGDLLVTDVKGGTGSGAIYRIRRRHFGFETGQAYSASDSYGIVGTLNVDDGVVTPIVTGLKSARGLVFLPHEHEERE